MLMRVPWEWSNAGGCHNRSRDQWGLKLIALNVMIAHKKRILNIPHRIETVKIVALTLRATGLTG